MRVPAEPMDEHQLRERMALLTRKTEEMHHEVMVLRETVPAKVRQPPAPSPRAPRSARRRTSAQRSHLNACRQLTARVSRR